MSNTPSYAHQDEAVDALWTEFETRDRGTILAACGTGKTRKQSKVLQKHLDAGAKHLLVMAPTIDLVYQNAEAYLGQLGDQVEIIAISSDAGRGDSNAIPTLDTAEEIHAKMAGSSKPLLIVSTYDSAPKVGAAQRLHGGMIPIQGGIFDEAHTTAGDKDLEAMTAFALQDENLFIEKRSFYTATPRASTKALKNSAAISMADQALYGRVVYNFPYSAAREAGIVTDYSIYVPVVTKAEIAELMDARGLDESASQNLLAEIATLKVMEETGQSRFISYHNRIAGSQAFSKSMAKALEGQDFHIAHVDAKTPRDARNEHIKTMRSGEKYLISNADIFREGTDAQALQGAIIVDPSSSQVKIIQTISRPMRTDPADPNKVASIVVPLLVDDASTEAILEAAQSSRFKTVIEVAEAMRHTDNQFDQDVRRRSFELGAKITPSKERSSGTKFKLVGRDMSDEDKSRISEAVTVVALEHLKDPFSYTLGQYSAHITEHGEAPSRESEPKLHLWAEQQRRLHRDGKLDAEHARALDELGGWDWLPSRVNTKSLVATLEAFRLRQGRTPRLDAALKSGPGTPSAEQILAGYLDGAESYGLAEQNSVPKGAKSQEGKRLFALKDAGYPLYGERGRPPSEYASSIRGSLRTVQTQSGRNLIVFAPMGARAKAISFVANGLDTVVGTRVTLSPESAEEHARLLKIAQEPNIVTMDFPKDVEPNMRISGGTLKDASNARIDVVASGLESVLLEVDGVTACDQQRQGWKLTPSQMNRVNEAANPVLYARGGISNDLPVIEVHGANDAGKAPKRYILTSGRLRLRDLQSRQASEDYFVPVRLDRSRTTGASIEEMPDLPPRRFREHLPGSPEHVAAALHDWKIAGKPDPCTQVNISRGRIANSDTAPNLGPEKPMTVAEMRGMIEAVQEAHTGGRLSRHQARKLEAAPGFSFIETSKLAGRIAPTIAAIVDRHGAEIFSDPSAREGDNGLANTLKVIDHVVANARNFPDAQDDLKQVSQNHAKDRLLVSIQAVNQARRRASENGREGQSPADQRRSAAVTR